MIPNKYKTVLHYQSFSTSSFVEKANDETMESMFQQLLFMVDDKPESKTEGKCLLTALKEREPQTIIPGVNIRYEHLEDLTVDSATGIKKYLVSQFMLIVRVSFDKDINPELRNEISDKSLVKLVISMANDNSRGFKKVKLDEADFLCSMPDSDCEGEAKIYILAYKEKGILH